MPAEVTVALIAGIAGVITGLLSLGAAVYQARQKAKADKALAGIQKQQADAEKERQKQAAQIEGFKAQIDAANANIAAAEKNIGMMRGINDELAETNGRLLAQNGKQEAAIEALRAEVRENVTKNDDLSRAVINQEAVIGEIKNENARLEDLVKGLRETTNTQAEQISDLESAVEERDQRIEAMDAKIAGQTATIETLKQQSEEKDLTIKGLRLENTTLSERVKRLEDERQTAPREIE